MTSAEDRLLSEAVRRGQFKEVVAKLSSHASSQARGRPVQQQIMLAEALAITGNQEAASNLARAILQFEKANKSISSRCNSLLGDAAFVAGLFTDSLAHYNTAIKLAEEAPDLEQLCNAQLKLLANIGSISPSEKVAALISQVRRNVLRLGDPHLVAELHLHLALLEGQRGLVHNAKEHIRIGRGLIESEPNAYLEGRFAIQASVVFFVDSDLHEAMLQAKLAQSCGEQSGAARIRFAAAANTGLLCVHAGDLESAERHLEEALRIASEMGKGWRVSVLESFAQLRLVQGRLEDCDKFLALLEQEMPMDNSRQPSWHEMETYKTRMRLCMQRQQWQQAVRLGSQAISIAAARSDEAALICFHVLTARAAIGLGRFDEGASLLHKAEGAARQVPFGTVAELQRVKGKLLAQLGETAAARSHFERALRIADTTGNISARAEIAADYANAVRPPESYTQDSSTTTGTTETHASTTPERCAETTTSTRSQLMSTGLEETAAFFDLAPHPELLGREVFTLLDNTGSVRAMALVAQPDEDKRLEILEAKGWSQDEVRQNARRAQDTSTMILGTARGREYSLIVETQDNIVAQSAVQAVWKLVAAAVALEDARRAERERQSLWPIDPDPEKRYGVFVSPDMIEILNTARKIGSTDFPVLITGETGTGKELLARSIHAASPRAERTFLPFNCTAVPRDMLESQLFGHRRGAFTGAHENFLGIIRSATGGTLFLDEIGEIGTDLQPKFLRFLETSEIHPLGEQKPLKVDVRIIAATNANLDQLVSEGRFREDLFYRLNVIRFRLPPLRERREEILPLVNHFLRRYGDELRKGTLRLSEEAVEYLLLYSWPGNVRQLENEVRRIAALAETNALVTVEHLSADLRTSRRTISATAPPPNHLAVRLDQPLGTAIAHIERTMVLRALDESDGRVEHAAKLLGISRKGLYLKRHRLGLVDDSSPAS